MEGSLLWVGLAMGLMAPAAMAQNVPTPAPAPVLGGETQALVDRLVSEGLAARDQKIAELERRIEKLESGKTSATPATSPAVNTSNGAEHVIAEGETLRRIAQIHGVTPEALASANNISVNQFIFPGQKLRIPGKTPSTPSPAPASSGAGSYVVKEGDTLTSIARAHSTTVDELKRLNGISNAAYITIGSTLRVSGAAPASPAPAKTSSNSSSSSSTPAAPVEEQYHYYPVAAGDTLGSIAKNFFTTVDELVRLNKFPSANVTLNAGQEVIVPTKKYFEAMRGGGNTVG